MTPRSYQNRCNPARRENKKPVIHWCSRIQHVQNIVRLFVYLDVAVARHVGDRRCEGPSRSSRSTESRLEQHRAGRALLQEDTVSETRKRFDDATTPIRKYANERRPLNGGLSSTRSPNSPYFSLDFFSYADALQLNATGQFPHNTLPSTPQEDTVNTQIKRRNNWQITLETTAVKWPKWPQFLIFVSCAYFTDVFLKI